MCGHGCPAEDPVLAEALSPWWDIRFTARMWNDMCKKIGSRWQLAFQAVVSNGRVHYRECSLQHAGETGDVEMLLDLVLGLARVVGFPDVIFNFNVGDQPFTDKVYWSSVPQFHWVLAKGHWTIPFPTPMELKSFLTNDLGDRDNVMANQRPWQSRKAKVFWRGTLSIPDHTPFELLQGTPRIRLMRLSKQRPDLFDVGLTSLDPAVQDFFTHQQVEWMSRFFNDHKAPHADFKDTLPQYKFVLNVAAVLSSWRVVELLSSGAVLLMQENSDLDLQHARLEPWVHYVPVRNDLSDLIERVDYLIAHDMEAQSIAKAGFDFFLANVTRSNTACYVWRAIRSIAGNTDLKQGSIEKLLRRESANWIEVTQSSSEAFLGSRLAIRRKEL